MALHTYLWKSHIKARTYKICEYQRFSSGHSQTLFTGKIKKVFKTVLLIKGGYLQIIDSQTKKL